MAECPQDGCTADVVGMHRNGAIVEWSCVPDGRWRFGVFPDHQLQRFIVICSAGHKVFQVKRDLPAELYDIIDRKTPSIIDRSAP